ncbi:MAG: hypothetical protein QFC55_03565 [Chloroflexota bacterium]|nr:hypothetical protein [Chloroflexota bacterium]
MPAPSPAEGDAAPRTAMSGSDSPTHFGPVIAGLVIWSTLFPHAAPMFGELSTIRRSPHIAWLDGSFAFALFTSYDQVKRQVEALFGPDSTAEDEHRRGDVRYHHEPRRNDYALDELHSVRALLLRLYGPPEAWADHLIRYETGLEHVDLTAAGELDDILRRDVHRRLVRLGSDEPILDDDLAGGVLTVDGGVFPAFVPESLAGVFALDYADGLAGHRRVAQCGRCERALVISNQQAARIGKGLPIYHRECAQEHRRDYYREYQRARRGGVLVPVRESAP